MSREQWTAVDRYITDLLVPADPVLEGALAANAVAGLPAIDVSANEGKFLELLARIQGASRILEFGTLGGYSTIWLARALPAGGLLITLELEPAYAAVAESNIARAGLSDRVDIRIGAADDSLKQLEAEGAGPFDMIFIDADKQNNPLYFEWALKFSRVGTLIIADNVVREGEVINADTDDPSVQGVRRFYELVAGEPRVSATAIQTVGVKGYDGFGIALVVGD